MITARESDKCPTNVQYYYAKPDAQNWRHDIKHQIRRIRFNVIKSDIIKG